MGMPLIVSCREAMAKETFAFLLEGFPEEAGDGPLQKTGCWPRWAFDLVQQGFSCILTRWPSISASKQFWFAIWIRDPCNSRPQHTEKLFLINFADLTETYQKNKIQ